MESRINEVRAMLRSQAATLAKLQDKIEGFCTNGNIPDLMRSQIYNAKVYVDQLADFFQFAKEQINAEWEKIKLPDGK